jgi:hypothetical protein
MATGHKTGGRQVGTLNKATADIKALAQSYGPAAIRSLAQMAGMIPGEAAAFSEAARTAAIKELLDRGYGKAVQPQSGADGTGPVVTRVIYSWADPEDDEQGTEQGTD